MLQEDIVGFFYIRVTEEKNHEFRAKSPFGDDLEQMRSSGFQKLGCPPAFQLLVMDSEEIALILNCNHLFIKSFCHSKIIHYSFIFLQLLISVFPQGTVLMFLYLKDQKLLSYLLFCSAMNASADTFLEQPG